MFELGETGEPITLSLKGIVLALSQVITGLRNCSDISSMCRRSALWVVCLCDRAAGRGSMHVCMFVCFFCMCHRSSTPYHWWLVDGVQSRDISVAMTTGKPHPVSYTQPPQHAPFRTKQWKEGPVWWYRRWGLTGAEKNKMNHPTVVDRSKQSIIYYIIYYVKMVLSVTPFFFFFLAQKTVLHCWNIEFTVRGNHFWSVNILLIIPY